MWQSNVSWNEGLFTEIPFKRFQAIRTKSDWDSPLAIFTRVNPTKGNDWPNLRFNGIQSPTSVDIGRFDTLFSPGYYIVAVDTRKKRTECAIEIRTLDHITGNVRVTVEYQVSSLETLLTVEDPLAGLKDRVEEEIRNIASRKKYSLLNESAVKEELQALEMSDEIGIELMGFLNLKIEWPESITRILVDGVIDEIDDQEQQKLNKRRRKKLNDFGITDPLLIASVLSKKDSDFDVIMEQVRSVSGAYKDQIERDLALLNWLKEQDLLTRADVQKVIGSLTDRINDQSSITSPIIKGMISSVANDDQMLASGEDLDKMQDDSEQERDEEQTGPIVTGKRKVQLPDDKEND